MKEVKRWIPVPGASEVVAAADYDSLLRKFAEVERDAKRYRWLRDNHPNCNFFIKDTGDKTLRVVGTPFLDEHCDRNIDSAMPGETHMHDDNPIIEHSGTYDKGIKP